MDWIDEGRFSEGGFLVGKGVNVGIIRGVNVGIEGSWTG